MDVTSVARGVAVAVSVPAGGSAPNSGQVLPAQTLIPPSLTVQGTANPGDNVSVSASTNDSDGFTTTGVTLLNGATVLGSMTSGGGGSWSYTINAITAGTYNLIARRATAQGNADSVPQTLVVGSGNQPGNINVNAPTGVLQTDLTTGVVEVGV